jgi:hypothetical protein
MDHAGSNSRLSNFIKKGSIIMGTVRWNIKGRIVNAPEPTDKNAREGFMLMLRHEGIRFKEGKR